MRKLVIAIAAVIGMTSVAHADWNGHRHHPPRHHYHQGGGDAGAALFGGLVGGLIIGGMISNSQQYYYNEPRGYVPTRRRYQPACQNVFMGSYWDGWRWVNQYQVICD